MKFLIAARQKKNVDAFRPAIIRLLEQGHSVRLAMQGRDPLEDARVSDGLSVPGFSLESAPTARGDQWRTLAPLVRRVRDWLQYLGPAYAGADTLRLRVVDRLRTELGVNADAFGDGMIAGLAGAQVQRLGDVLEWIEAAMPSDRLHEDFIRRDMPDVVLVTPGVHFGSAQADIIKSARAAGVPVGMLVFSWDNLSTKGALHVAPDVMFVWNERQRSEAATLHGFPPERVIAVGAPRFDEFFTLAPVVPRARFLGPLGLDADAPTLLYLCSSRFVARHELPFVRRWLAAVRRSGDPSLARCNVIVRPHPDIPLLPDDEGDLVRWPALQRAEGRISRPFSDDRAVVLRTTYSTPQAFFECLYHSAAVVGLNTSAELEAGIVGRPVFTVVADDQAVTGQANTLHFHYLLRENGGFVVPAPTLDAHVADLAGALATPPDEAGIRAFVREFLRPGGDRPASEVLAEALVQHFEGRRQRAPEETVAVPQLPVARHAGFLRVAYPGSSLRVRATHETRKRRQGDELALDSETVAWLDTHVQPNDVVYDIGAGVGEYSLVAATHRNATVVAFEPGFATFKRLCDHILLNDCRQGIVPLSIVLGDRAGLLELLYTHVPGEDRHTLRPRPWRRRPYDAEAKYSQPVIAERLDDAIARYSLPRPTHIRIFVPRGADGVVRGAAATLRDPALKSVFVVAPRHEVRPALEQEVAASGLALVPPPRRTEHEQRLLFVREGAASRTYIPAVSR